MLLSCLHVLNDISRTPNTVVWYDTEDRLVESFRVFHKGWKGFIGCIFCVVTKKAWTKHLSGVNEKRHNKKSPMREEVSGAQVTAVHRCDCYRHHLYPTYLAIYDIRTKLTSAMSYAVVLTVNDGK